MAKKKIRLPSSIYLGGNISYWDRDTVKVFLGEETSVGNNRFYFSLSNKKELSKAFYRKTITENLIFIMPSEWGEGMICFDGSQNFSTSFFGIISEEPVLGKEIEVICVTQREETVYVKRVVPDTIINDIDSESIRIFKSDNYFYLCYKLENGERCDRRLYEVKKV